MATTDSEAQARAVEQDIERTRQEMDETLSQLERKLAPSEIVHQGAESMRQRARGLASTAVDTLKSHPVPVALAIGVALARYAYRPGPEERLRLQADDDLERAWRMLRTGLSRAKDRGLAREAELERRAMALAQDAGAYVAPALETAQRFARRGSEDAWRLLRQAADASRTTTRALRDGSSTHPLATVALLGLAVLLGARRMRARW